MKLSGYILIVLMIGFCFALVGSVILDFETQYPDIDVNTSWESKYSYQSQLKNETTLLQSMIEKMNSEDIGWFKRTLLGVAAIPVAIFTAIGTMIKSLGYGITIITGVGKDIGVPAFVLPFVITAFTIIILWGIISWWRSKSKA